MCCPNKEIRFDDFILTIGEDVYEPAEDSMLFAENLHVKKGSTVLDMGTGCGILAIVAAKKASNVLAIDVSPHAVRCAKQNATVNRLAERIGFLRTDLFSGLAGERRFDLILFNAPYLPCNVSDESSWLDKAWAGGCEGREVIDRFMKDVSGHLKPRGEILLMQSSLSDCEKSINNLALQGLSTGVVAKRRLPFFEELCLIRAQASS